jgi:ubiquinone/menaquinone biosynthesis C-methylase UbiE
MKVKEHYDNHLGNFYSWYTGDFEKNKNDFKAFCKENQIVPGSSKIALDLGAGNGIQTIALAESGFMVLAIDFNKQLLSELDSKIGNLPIIIQNDDFRNFENYSDQPAQLIVCCGDTITHLESVDEIKQLIAKSFNLLVSGGKIILTFRDYSTELEDTQRFIHVKSDNSRIFTCFLEYFTDRIRVTDLLYELEGDKWLQKVSSYYKMRLLKGPAIAILNDCGFDIILNIVENRIITLIGQKY